MTEMYEVLLIDGDSRWHAGWVIEKDADLLLHVGGAVPVWSSRAGLEHHAQEHGLSLVDDLPDEIDLDLGGWISTGAPQPTTAEVSELWHLLIDDPTGRELAKLEDAYDDLTDDEPDWFEQHGETSRRVLAAAVVQLRGTLRPM
ncbi:MAG: hypothetical protein QOE05_3032 [Actinomycetota bacterium]|jgi:hypothetical protein|nr:hypothetical protein [Actinomycetota bacterium]